ncbi:unnamed protein product, partial [Larinioides sclopetarius]
MDEGRLEGQEDKLYVVIAYADDMQIFICNRDVFLLRLSQKYRIPKQNIGFYDYEVETPSAMIDVKDIRDGMILQMVNKLELPTTSVTEEASHIASKQAQVKPFRKRAKRNVPEDFASHPKGKAKIPRRCGLPVKEKANKVEASVSSPKIEGNPREVAISMPSTSSTSEETPRFKRIKISYRSGKDDSNF